MDERNKEIIDLLDKLKKLDPLIRLAVDFSMFSNKWLNHEIGSGDDVFYYSFNEEEIETVKDDLKNLRRTYKHAVGSLNEYDLGIKVFEDSLEKAGVGVNDKVEDN